MIDFTVYDGPTGRILRVGQSQPSTLHHQALGDSEAMIFGVFDADTHYISQGRARMRPVLPAITLNGQGWEFDGLPPEGTAAQVQSLFIDGTFDIDARTVALAVPEPAQVQITAPWPYQDVQIELDGTPQAPVADAQIIGPDLDRMKDHFGAELYRQADALMLSMLGNPDENTQKRWLVKRAIFDKFEAGNLSESDRAALAEEVRYSGETVEDHLTVIGKKVAFQNWVTFRSDGLRAEAENRLDGATIAEEALAAITWAETESANAVAEAQALLTAG